MKKGNWVCCVILIFLLSLCAGCASSIQPYAYEPDHELKKGPGLFSGEPGTFTIYRKPAETDENRVEK